MHNLISSDSIKSGSSLSKSVGNGLTESQEERTPTKVRLTLQIQRLFRIRLSIIPVANILLTVDRSPIH